MSKRKMLKRAVKDKVVPINESSHSEYNSSDAESDDNESSQLLQVLLALQRSAQKKPKRAVRKPRKRKSSSNNSSQNSQNDPFHLMGLNCSSSGRKRAPRVRKPRQPRSQRSIATMINLECDDEKSNENVGDSHLKNIEDKIDNFFKSRRLVSDEEDNAKVELENEIDPAPKKPKDFYMVVSDSEDEVAIDKPSTSTDINTPSTSDTCNISRGTNIVDENKPDELMNLVDSILQPDDDQIQKLSQPDASWEEYKKKTEEMLGSVSVLIHGLKGNDNKTETPVLNENDSPKKVTPSCPICLETLGVREAAATICGHMFCKACITHVATTTKKCPTCRKKLNTKKIHPVYF